MDDRLDVLDYILLLPDLVMKRNLERCQRLEYHSDIYLRPASDTEMYIRKFQIHEVFNQIQDLLTGGRPSREIRAFVESIKIRGTSQVILLLRQYGAEAEF